MSTETKPTADAIVDDHLEKVAEARLDAQREAAPQEAERMIRQLPSELQSTEAAVREVESRMPAAQVQDASSSASPPRPSTLGLLSANREPPRSAPRPAQATAQAPAGKPGDPGAAGVVPGSAPTPKLTGGQQAVDVVPKPIEAMQSIGVHVVPVVPQMVEHPAVTDYKAKWGIK